MSLGFSSWKNRIDMLQPTKDWPPQVNLSVDSWKRQPSQDSRRP